MQHEILSIKKMDAKTAAVNSQNLIVSLKNGEIRLYHDKNLITTLK